MTSTTMAGQNETASFERISLPQRHGLGLSLSLLLHAAFGAWIWTSVAPTTTPLGAFRKGSATIVELAEGGFSSAPPAKKAKEEAVVAPPKPSELESVLVSRKKTNELKKEIAAEDPIPQASAATASGTGSQLGFANGTTTQGELGQANGMQVSARERYLYELRVLLEEKKDYPTQARRLGETGRVIVTFEIQPGGEIVGSRIKTPSPYARLNEAALKLVQETQRFRPLPVEIAQDKLIVDVPIDYRLRE